MMYYAVCHHAVQTVLVEIYEELDRWREAWLVGCCCNHGVQVEGEGAAGKEARPSRVSFRPGNGRREHGRRSRPAGGALRRARSRERAHACGRERDSYNTRRTRRRRRPLFSHAEIRGIMPRAIMDPCRAVPFRSRSPPAACPPRPTPAAPGLGARQHG
jgi:hypothetical protein